MAVAKKRTSVKKGETTRKKKETAEKPAKFITAVGKRKNAIAIVRMFSDKGAIIINGKTLEQYFPLEKLRAIARSPFIAIRSDILRLEIRIAGGGLMGQAEAARLGIARALLKYRPEIRPQLRAAGFLTRDARVKERRKYGLKKARRAPQWAKR
jgi:small subunit ribosomal protein S9